MNLLEDALCFATKKHEGQTRKGGVLPYILHPVEVAAIVGTLTEDQVILAAAVLHDTLEDTETTYEELEQRFGKRVADLVAAESEKKRKDRSAESTWRIRKEETLRDLKNCDDPAVKMICLGDKLSNMRSIYRSYRKIGNDLWNDFHQKDPAAQSWYYRSVAELLSELKDTEAYREYRYLTDIVFETSEGSK